MSTYQHKKGKIQDNALEALLHDPLFRQRIEKNKKGKGSYCRKGKYGKGQNGEAGGKLFEDNLPPASQVIVNAYAFYANPSAVHHVSIIGQTKRAL